MSWATLLKAGFKFMGRGAAATVKTVGKTALHTATKTAAIGAGAGYVAWEKLTTDKSVARIVGDAVVGSDTIDNVSQKVDGAVQTVTDLKEGVGNAID